MKRLRWLVVVAAWGGSWIAPAAATPLNLVTGLSRNIAPGESTLLDIAIANQAPGDVTDFNAFLLALQLLPQQGASGSLSIISAAQPTTGAMLSDPEVIFNPSGSVAPSLVNGSSGFVGVILANNDSNTGDFLAAGETANLVSLTLTALGGTSGTWKLYAITNAMPISAWQTTESSDVAFGNLPIPPSGSFSSLELGTVTVFPVPEPADILFPAMLGIVVIGAGRRAARALPLRQS
jgi:hypothetical protein